MFKTSSLYFLWFLFTVVTKPLFAQGFTPVSASDSIHIVQAMVDGQMMDRYFVVHRPPIQNNLEIDYPVVFIFHGRGQKAHPLQDQTPDRAFLNTLSISEYSGFDAVADREGFITVYPISKNSRWNDELETDVDDLGFFDAMLVDLEHNYSINPNKIYSCGLSNGGFLSQKLAELRGDKLAAVGVVAASMRNSMAINFNPVARIPIAMICGTSDFIVRYEQGYPGEISVPDAFNLWLDANGLGAISPQSTSINSDNRADRVLLDNYTDATGFNMRLYTVEQGGHTWPGSPTTISVFGRVNRDINASEVLWDFFQQAEVSSALINPVLMVVPNPVINDDFNVINIRPNERIEFFTRFGRAMSVNDTVRMDSTTLRVLAPRLRNGIYFGRVSGAEERYVRFEIAR